MNKVIINHLVKPLYSKSGCVCGVLIKPLAAAIFFFSPFIAFKITAIHIKTTLEYSHYKTLQNNLTQ